MLSHPQRQQIADEVHARPFQQLAAPIKVMHFALMTTGCDIAKIRSSLSALFIQCGTCGIGDEDNFYFQKLKNLSIRWEAHTEYHTLTFYYSGDEQDWQQSMPGLPADWCDQVPGQLITGVQLLTIPAPDKFDPRGPTSLFGDNQIIGSQVMRGAGTIWTDFKAYGKFGLDRILVYDNHLHGFQCGRLLQRLCEIDTYRAVALLGLRPAQQSMTQIADLEAELSVISSHLSKMEPGEQEDSLNALMKLAAQLEEVSVSTAHRFSASDAYYAMVRMRIVELEESRLEGLPTMTQFIERRVDPAMRTWRSAASRINLLSKRISQASGLLRSTIDLSTDQQVHKLLTSMNKRTRRQLLLQAKLETFSIIVVTYYIFDLIERSIRYLTIGEIQNTAIHWLSYSLPAVVLIVWWYVRRVTKEFKSDD